MVLARIMAQQLSAQVEVAISPHQHALKTKAGCETVAHLSSRNAMMSGLRFMVDGDRMLPFNPPATSGRTTWVKSIPSHKVKEVSKETL